MDSATACVPAQDGRRSRIVVKRAGSDSLPSYQSLRNSRDFRRVLSDGKRRRKGGVVVVSSPGSDGPPRLGLLVSRSCGTAVKRNRIKRRLRAAAESVELQPGIDYVIIATSQVADAPYQQLVSWLVRALEETADA
jgi:ribonuclease P protein component